MYLETMGEGDVLSIIDPYILICHDVIPQTTLYYDTYMYGHWGPMSYIEIAHAACILSTWKRLYTGD